MFRDPDFTPFQARARASYRAVLHNYLENWPPAAYREGYCTIRGLWPVTPDAVFLSDPELIEEVLVSRAEMFTHGRVFSRIMSADFNESSLIFAEGVDWRWQRRALSPAFRHENLLKLVPVFAQSAKTLTEEWRRSRRTDPIDVAQAMTRTTFDVIERAVLGSEGYLEREEFTAALASGLENVGWRLIYAYFHLPRFFPYPGSTAVDAAMRHLGKEASRALARRRDLQGERHDILELLLSARDPETGRVMTDRELAANLYTFIVAGHETAAIALTWTLWLLAKDQTSQDRVRNEISRFAGARDIDAEEVEQLTFTRQVIQEAMRLFPPAPGIARQARENTTIGPHKVSKSASITIATWCLHRHEKLWEEPAAFDPDRFALDKSRERHRCAYLPFGAGPRICIGMNFAMLEMTTIVATLLREFRLRSAPCHRPQIGSHVFLRPLGGMPLLIEPL